MRAVAAALLLLACGCRSSGCGKDPNEAAIDPIRLPFFGWTYGVPVLIGLAALAATSWAGLDRSSARPFTSPQTVTAERALSYMEPPYWYYAARLSLGAALLKTGQAAEAEKVFRETLKDLPANGWPLYGLEQSLRAQGKEAEAKQVAKDFKKAWKHADVKLDLAWF